MTTPDLKNPNLNILRGISVILVLFAHLYPPSLYEICSRIEFLKLVQPLGHIGVDIFFVLSAALISTLLLTEWKETGAVEVRRFLTRRALKILPSFFLLTVTAIPLTVVTHRFSLRQLLAEISFTQSYFNGLWSHTWSIAVEEHFYLLFAGLFWFLRKYQRPFRLSVTTVVATCFLFASLRYLIGRQYGFQNETLRFPSHLRIDTFLVGILIGVKNVYPQTNRWADRISNLTWVLIAAACVALTLRLNIYSTYRYENSFGLVLNAVMGGSLIYPAFRIQSDPIWYQRLTTPLRYVGECSYNIYLWHFGVIYFAVDILHQNALLGITGRFLLYFLGSIALGVFVTKCFEIPILRWRDQHFPGYRRQKATSLPATPNAA